MVVTDSTSSGNFSWIRYERTDHYREKNRVEQHGINPEASSPVELIVICFI